MKASTGIAWWSNIAYLAATICFVKANWVSIASAEIWAVYLGVVGLHMSTDKLIELRFGPARDNQHKDDQ